MISVSPFATLIITLIVILIITIIFIKKYFKLVLIYTTSILLSILIYEYVLYYRAAGQVDSLWVGSKEEFLTASDTIKLGYDFSRPNGRCNAIKILKSDTVYNVNYTIENYERITPESCSKSFRKILFLGCSHVFGIGLNDKETLPYWFNTYLNENWEIHNLAKGGYGTHQAVKTAELVMSNLESRSGRVDSFIMIYNLLPSHFTRSGGKSFWDIYGPWYEAKNDTLIELGKLNQMYSWSNFPKNIKSLWWKSLIYYRHFLNELIALGVCLRA
jgi:hypothetical protein